MSNEVEFSNLPMLGLDWRDAVKQLHCTRPELFRWMEEGRLPYDGRVRTYRFSSMSRSYSTIEGGWRPETIQPVKPHLEEWRAENEAQRKLQQKQRAKNRQIRLSEGTEHA